MPVKERPILFSGPMVRALLDGRKTQTRRVAKTFAPVEFNPHDDREYVLWHAAKAVARVPARNPHEEADLRMACPYGEPGDRLWVRETFCSGDMGPVRPGCPIAYRADHECTPGPWTPSIHMPRWASRITLAVTSVRVERLQEITTAEIRAEGVDDGRTNPKMCARHDASMRMAFESLWDSINGKRPGCSWDANPWVWVIGFEVVR